MAVAPPALMARDPGALRRDGDLLPAPMATPLSAMMARPPPSQIPALTAARPPVVVLLLSALMALPSTLLRSLPAPEAVPSAPLAPPLPVQMDPLLRDLVAEDLGAGDLEAEDLGAGGRDREVVVVEHWQKQFDIHIPQDD